MILIINSQAMGNAARQGYFECVSGLRWGPRSPRCVMQGPLGLGKIDL